MYNDFESYLKRKYLAENTRKAYIYAIKQFGQLHDELNMDTLKLYKLYLLERYKPQTVNLRIRAVNCYLEFLQIENWNIPAIKVQQKPFLDHIISDADYEYFKTCLKRDGELYWYFVIRFMAATGARVSELIQFKVEHVKLGYFDLYSKGGKLRRIYIPLALQKEAINWLEALNKKSGFIFVNKYGKQITSRGIAGQLKKFASRYRIDIDVVYPHSFRHRFAKNFLEHFNDLALLADLMGHESIETTRIYLRRTSTEQQNIINQIVSW